MFSSALRYVLEGETGLSGGLSFYSDTEGKVYFITTSFPTVNCKTGLFENEADGEELILKCGGPGSMLDDTSDGDIIIPKENSTFSIDASMRTKPYEGNIIREPNSTLDLELTDRKSVV